MRHLKQSLALMLLSSFNWSCTLSQGPVAMRENPKEHRAVTTAATAKTSSTLGTDSLSNEINSQSLGQKGCDRNLSASMALPQLFTFYLKTTWQQGEEERIRQQRAKEVWQDSEYTLTGNEQGTFLDNPLMLDGTPLDYGRFTLQSSGELTVSKKSPVTGQIIQVPFNIYLRRDGIKISLSGVEPNNLRCMKVELSQILKHAQPGDHLVIEAVKEEDGAVKRILKLLNLGC